MGQNNKQKNGSLRSVLRVPRGPVDVKDFDPDATPRFPGAGKEDAAAEISKLVPTTEALQERLVANAATRQPRTPSVLVVLQAMDGGGKDGATKAIDRLFNPHGVRIKDFKAPSEEERMHDFLWRVRNAAPKPGEIVIFNRSHYEDVLIQRVEQMAPPEEIETRYHRINEFEREMADNGTRILKCYLNVSKAQQKQRFVDRLTDPEKYWKYNPGDLQVRARWSDYMDAYSIAMERCNEDFAPWYVIPGDPKWYRDWAVSVLLEETLEDMGLRFPAPNFDVEAERAKVAAS